MNLTRLSTNTSTTLGGTGIGIKLHVVTINTKGAAANTLTLAVGSTTIAVIDTTSAVTSLIYDCDLTGPVTATLATGTPADVSITWS
jgi:hypothetical protein